MRFVRILLIIIAVVCFGVALSYPIRYRMAQESNNANMDALSAMREKARQAEDAGPAADGPAAADVAAGASGLPDGGGETPRPGDGGSAEGKADASVDGAVRRGGTPAGDEAPARADATAGRGEGGAADAQGGGDHAEPAAPENDMHTPANADGAAPARAEAPGDGGNGAAPEAERKYEAVGTAANAGYGGEGSGTGAAEANAPAPENGGGADSGSAQDAKDNGEADSGFAQDAKDNNEADSGSAQDAKDNNGADSGFAQDAKDNGGADSGSAADAEDGRDRSDPAAAEDAVLTAANADGEAPARADVPGDDSDAADAGEDREISGTAANAGRDDGASENAANAGSGGEASGTGTAQANAPAPDDGSGGADAAQYAEGDSAGSGPVPSEAPGAGLTPPEGGERGDEADSAPDMAPRSEGTPEPTPGPTTTPTPEPTPTPTPGIWDLILNDVGPATPEPAPERTPTPEPTATPEPSPTPNRRVHTGALPYPMLEKVTLDESAILPELKEIYELNRELVGWITIPDTVIDYPVVQTKDSEFYLKHDFYGEENVNGQIILDTLCDPYTPSYNLVISGHHMKNGSMFGNLPLYATRSYWQKHKFMEFDTLMARKQYVVFACFYSADYDEDEEGFRYNADIQYAKDAELWLAEIRANQVYDTGIDATFGDEFITLTTCNRARHRNGRFVVVCRKIREGETFE